MSHVSIFRPLCLALLTSLASMSAHAGTEETAETNKTAAETPAAETPAVEAPAVEAKEEAKAEDLVLAIKDHMFTPESLTIPADKEVTITVRNEDDTAEEFESESLDREKIIAPGAEAKINVGPLKPGTYEFKGEFHEDSAKGVIIVE